MKKPHNPTVQEVSGSTRLSLVRVEKQDGLAEAVVMVSVEARVLVDPEIADDRDAVLEQARGALGLMEGSTDG